MQPPNWPGHYTVTIYSNNRRQWSSQPAENSPAGPVRDHFETFLVYNSLLKTILWIFTTFSLDSPCKMLLNGTKIGFSLLANLGGSQTLKSPSILSPIKIGSEEMFLSSKEAFLLK